MSVKSSLITVGTHLKAKRHIRFCDGTFHKKDSYHIVTSESIAYYQVNSKDYSLVQTSPSKS